MIEPTTMASAPARPAAAALTEKDAARYICMSESYLRKARMDGDLRHHTPGPPFVKIGRAVRYLKEDLDQWLADHRISQVGGVSQ